ncbi:MAG TPA: hypothetical protein VIJ25_04650 [Methylococcales bacterium]
MKIKRLFAIFGLLLCLAAPLTTATVSAYDPLDAACNNADGTTNSATAGSVACSGRTRTNPIIGDQGILRKASNIMAILAGIAAIIVIIIGGMQYMTSGGDPQKAASARNMILGAIIGLVIIAVAQAIIIFILSRV